MGKLRDRKSISHINSHVVVKLYSYGRLKKVFIRKGSCFVYRFEKTKIRSTPLSIFSLSLQKSTPTNLPLRNRPDPNEDQVQSNDDNTHNPKHPRVMRPVVPEDNREDDATQVPRSTYKTRQHTVSMGMHMRHKSKVGAIPSFQEDSHEGDETHHSREVFRVELSDYDEEDSGHDADEVDPEFLGPQVAVGPAEDEVGEEAARGARDDVEQTEHGGPLAGRGLAELREVLEVVGAEDGVDGELAAEGADVRRHEHDGLEGAGDAEGFLGRGFDDHFVLHFV